MNAYTVGSARIPVMCVINRSVARVISRDTNAYTMDSVPVCVMYIINCSSSGVYVELSSVCSVICLHSCSIIDFRQQYHILQKHLSRQMRATLVLWFHK